MQRKGNYEILEDKLEMMVESCNPALGRQGQELQPWGQHDLTYSHTLQTKNETNQDKNKNRAQDRVRKTSK